MSPIKAFFRLDDRISTGAQPTPDDVAWLAAAGFKAVLNTNTSTARNFVPDEGERLAGHGIDYVHHPIDCSVLTPATYEGFRDALNRLLAKGGPVFVHCAGNVKVTGLMYLYRVLERGERRERVASDLEKLPTLEAKWPAFWASLGAH